MRSLQPWAITMAYNSGEADRLLPFEEPRSTSRNSPQSQEFSVDLRTVHEVRIHLPPPCSLNCRETLRLSSSNTRESPAFRGISSRNRTRENSQLSCSGPVASTFLQSFHWYSGFKNLLNRMLSDHK